MSNDSIQDQKQQHGGHFAAGLFLGGLAAAAGVFLFGTKKGEKVTKDLKKNWGKLQQNLAQEIPARPNDKIKLPFFQVLQHTLEYAAKRLQDSQVEQGKLSPKSEKKVKVMRSAQRGK